jgi:fructoselysine 3-epimerase
VHRIAALGYDGIEILCDHPHWFPPKATAADLAQLQHALSLTKLHVSNVNANTADGFFAARTAENAFEPSLDHPDATVRTQRSAYTRAAIDFAAALGAANISISSGWNRDITTRDASTKRFIESLLPLCDYAAAKQINIGIEYEPGLNTELAAQVGEIIDRVGAPHLGVNFDIGHSFLNGEPPEATTRLFAGRIWNVHVEDIKDNVHFHLVPGDGALPFERYFTTLHEIGYNRFLSVELYTFADKPDEAGARAISYLRQAVPHA